MSLILCLDTALSTASVALAEDGKILAKACNEAQADHAAWIHIAVRDLFQSSLKSLNDLSAVAVTSGPGSYTGLRVGMATAKGLCYALQIPLITENTLKLTAMAARNELQSEGANEPSLYCPMIDARRMEVFTAMYDRDLDNTVEPSAVVLDEQSFSSELSKGDILFCGNGAEKWQKISSHAHARFASTIHKIEDLAKIATEKYQSGVFSDLAYAEPEYFKHFYSGK